jgi:Raf kinase inhibitor-like YbhB/YbcL family protein
MKKPLISFTVIIFTFFNGVSLAMKISSPAFAPNTSIPTKFTCDGENISPQLNFADIPLNTQSLALIVDDPDAPRGTYTHWVLYNLPPSTAGLKENAQTLPAGTLSGKNSGGDMHYAGPCPPTGSHRYFFKLYALDAMLPLESGFTSEKLILEIKKHVITQTEMIGLYKKIGS